MTRRLRWTARLARRWPTRCRAGRERYAKGGRLTPWSRANVLAPRFRLRDHREPIVPLIGSAVTGPLGVAHLPRLWLEGVLAATGRLDPRFAGGNPLFDEVVGERIGLDLAAARAVLRRTPVPDYLTFEAWVREHARALDDASIAAANNAVGKATSDGVALTFRDDLRAWAAVHARVVDAAAPPPGPIVPAISTRSAGPLGIDHLPRLWLKALLLGCGALPVGYRSGSYRVVGFGLARVPGGIDANTARDLDLDVAAATAAVRRERLDEPGFEAWVAAHAGALDARAIAVHNATRDDTRPDKAALEKAYVGWDDPSNWSYLLDDLLDWKVIADVLNGAPLPCWAES